MIIYWAWPTVGAGHAVRAASICRHLKNEVLVIRGTDDPMVNRALDHFKVPYRVMPSKRDAREWVAQEGKFNTVILDGEPNSEIEKVADLYIWRLGRAERTRKRIPAVRVEGPGAMWPILMLEDDEILSREEAREELGIPQDRYTIIGVSSTHRPGIVEAANPDFMLTPDRWWPALKYLRAADHVVGAIGYNLYGEVNYLGLPHTWLRAGNSPDQAVRIFTDKAGAPEPRRGAARKVAEMIDQLHV